MEILDYERLTPRYLRVASLIKRKVLSGDYKEGQQLIPQHDLAKEYGVAFATLKQALDLLQREGYVSRKAGKGTFISVPSRFRGTALIVDDNDVFRLSFANLLDQLDWKAEEVKGGEDALKLLRNKDVDIVFLDLKMPGMNGVEAMSKIRNFNTDMPVVFITAYPDSELMQQAMTLGPITILPKPFTKEDVGHVLSYAMKARRQP